MLTLLNAVTLSACLFACVCALADPTCNHLLFHKVADGGTCGCLIGLFRVARRVAVANDRLAVFVAARTWNRLVFDVRLSLASGLLLGTVAVILTVLG